MPPPARTAAAFGYSEAYGEHVRVYSGYEFVRIGSLAKEKDLVWSDVDGWFSMPEQYYGVEIANSWRPISRPMLWACNHYRERSETCCPICIVFHRNISEKY